VSIFASSFDLSRDDHADGPAPITYRGSHILPSDQDLRAGRLDLAHIPGFIDRTDRPALHDGEEGDFPAHPWLRMRLESTDSDDPTEERRYADVLLDREQVAALHAYLGAVARPHRPRTERRTVMDWRHRAACRDEDPELHFPIGNSGPALLQIAEAKTVCRRCPVVSRCLAYALETNQSFGVWGGMSEDEREALKRRNARTRQRVRDAEEPAAPAERPTPVRVDGRLMAAPPTLLDRQYQDRLPCERRDHALMSNGRAACGSSRLDVGQRRPMAELGASRRCRSAACRKLFEADEALEVSHG
jgi:WhiB family redox-sensing transcriptional regulator